jgi:DNA modification methylase
MSALKIEYLSPKQLRPYPNNARTHSKKQIKQIAKSIERFGFNDPVLVSADNEVVAGHGRVEAAKLLGLDRVPTVRLANLSPVERRAYALTANRLAELSGWDREILAIELQGLDDAHFEEIEVTGFSLGEIDTILEEASEKSSDAPGPEDDIPAPSAREAAVSRMGDLWILGSHRLLCGDARNIVDYDRLLAGEHADVVLTDPPFNVPVEGHVSGLGRVRHENFAMASGEMSEVEFIAFLSAFLRPVKAAAKDGAILFVFMDWRHQYELITAAREANLAFKNLIVWVKDNAGMGTFYRSQHELVLVFKNGDAPHTNTFELGQYGRHRSNVWKYAGVNTFRAGRMEDLAMHPTVKPTALVADAIRDVTRRGAIVLDPFAGSGTTIIAAEKTGRQARAIEYEPGYCDVIVRRWQKYAGKVAKLEGTSLIFEDAEAARLAMAPAEESEARPHPALPSGDPGQG